MNDFAKSIQAGLERAKVAENAHGEIDAVLESFKAGVGEGTRGKVRVVVDVATLDMLASLLAKNRTAVQTLYLAAGNEQVAVASLGRSVAGFPVTVAFNDSSVNVVSADDLRSTLRDVLADVTTGRTLLRLMKVADAPPGLVPKAVTVPAPKLPARFAGGGDVSPRKSASLRTSSNMPSDSQRISINEAYEVLYWTQALGVTEKQLRNAVQKVGPRVKDVRVALGNSVKGAGPRPRRRDA